MKLPRFMMVAGVLLLLGVFAFPVWNIRLEAPQYPIPLGMNINIDGMQGEHEFDIKNINLMNHYVGMKQIPAHINEFDFFPYVVVAMVIAGVVIGLFAPPSWFFAWFVVMSLLGIAGMYDFYSWESDYGHNLNPRAIMHFTNPDGSVMGFQPPLFGTKHILNFTAYSYPRNGAFFVFASLALTFLAYLYTWLQERVLKRTSVS